MTSPGDSSPPNIQEHDDIEKHYIDSVERRYSQYNRRRALGGLGVIGVGMAACGVIGSGALAHTRFAERMPYSASAQKFVDNIDNGLEVAGEIALPVSLLAIGGVMVGGMVNSRLRTVDRWSSKEMSDDGKKTRGPSHAVRKGLAVTFAGGVPVVAMAGAALATFTTGISTEVSTGPSRPIGALQKYAPGDSMIVGFEGAQPMMDSFVSRRLANIIIKKSHTQGITAQPFDIDLGVISYKDQSFSGLFLGVETPASSKLRWTSSMGCSDIPVLVDKAAGIPRDSNIKLSGVNANVAGQTDGLSAINRVGAIVDINAEATCLKKDANAPYHALILNTNHKTARAILKDAEKVVQEPATVISTDQYLQNSENFWATNVKPITNELAVVSGGVVLLSISSLTGARLLRERREWAAKLAAGESEWHMRATELMRGTKNGVVAAVGGVAIATVATPLVNSIELGFKAGVGYKEAMVGAAVGTIGSGVGSLIKVLHPRKTINVAEHTRV